MGGDTPEEGRVEFCHNNNWGTVCDDSWGTVDASVVCRQLGFTPLGAASFSNATFGQGSGPILLDEVRCVGTESRLADCPADPIGVHKCEQSASAGVRCIAGMVLYRLYSGDVSKWLFINIKGSPQGRSHAEGGSGDSAETPSKLMIFMTIDCGKIDGKNILEVL